MYKFKVYFYLTGKYQQSSLMTVDVTANNFCDAQNIGIQTITAKYPMGLPSSITGSYYIWQITRMAQVPKGPPVKPYTPARLKCTDLPRLRNNAMLKRNLLNIQIKVYNNSLYAGISKSKLAQLMALINKLQKVYSISLAKLKALEERCKKRPIRPELEGFAPSVIFED